MQLAEGDAEEDHNRHGDSEPLKPIYSQPTSAFTRRDIEHRITLIGVNSWRQLHVCYILEHHRAWQWWWWWKLPNIQLSLLLRWEPNRTL